MDQKAIVGAIVAAAFVSLVLVGRIAFSRLRGKQFGAEAAAFSAVFAILAVTGIVAGTGLLERLLGW
jgi:hypothetical protein